MGLRRALSRAIGFAVAGLILSCGQNNHPLDVCGCSPSAPASEDFRHQEKHVPLPDLAPQEITVATMLTWPQTPLVADGAPRSGRELKMFHIARAFVHVTFEVPTDCDIHLEISDSPDKSAPRVIVETPVDSEYCPQRKSFQAQMASHGFTLGTRLDSGELSNPVPVDVLGLAFQDNPHSTRGTAQVQTVWELHPAIVKVTQ